MAFRPDAIPYSFQNGGSNTERQLRFVENSDSKMNQVVIRNSSTSQPQPSSMGGFGFSASISTNMGQQIANIANPIFSQMSILELQSLRMQIDAELAKREAQTRMAQTMFENMQKVEAELVKLEPALYRLDFDRFEEILKTIGEIVPSMDLVWDRIYDIVVKQIIERTRLHYGLTDRELTGFKRLSILKTHVPEIIGNLIAEYQKNTEKKEFLLKLILDFLQGDGSPNNTKMFQARTKVASVLLASSTSSTIPGDFWNVLRTGPVGFVNGVEELNNDQQYITACTLLTDRMSQLDYLQIEILFNSTPVTELNRHAEIIFDRINFKDQFVSNTTKEGLRKFPDNVVKANLLKKAAESNQRLY